jgi:pantothenate kinase
VGQARTPARSELIARASALGVPGRRALLGITGAPGAGKSRLAAALADAVPGSVVVPMDGFHRTTAELSAHGWVAERGTPRTFDADGYVAMLRELRGAAEVRAPAFDRSREEPVPGAIRVPASARLVITEGNYLLLDTPPWCDIRGLLDEVWFVAAPEPVRLERLAARHVEFGRPPDEARRRATEGSDAANARLVAATRSRADLIVDAAECQ